MKKTNFIGKRITVMGLGFHQGGEGVARFFAENGAQVTVTDLQTEEKLPEAIARLKDLPIRFVLGRHEEKDFIETDMVVRNPGVPHTSRFLQIAQDHGVPIEMESSLFFKLSPTRNIVAVTGTKGKSTTSHLAAHVCRESGLKTHLMGNLVKSMLGELHEITADSVVVLELSSYQCEGFAPYIEEFRRNGLGPQYAIITNLYADHLNRYSSMDEYGLAKKQLVLAQNEQQFAILNTESEWFDFFSADILSQILRYDSNTFPVETKLRLLGGHNRINVGAVYLMAQQMGLNMSQVEKSIAAFPGVEHRLEFVRSLNGVDFYNDTTATNPSAAVEGIRTIQELGRKIVLLAGGNDKGMDFEKFVDLINQSGIEVVVLEGTADEKLRGIEKELIVGKFTDYEEAISAAYKNALPDGIVLLSPGATSFNMFRDEFDRGSQFKDVVKGLNS